MWQSLRSFFQRIVLFFSRSKREEEKIVVTPVTFGDRTSMSPRARAAEAAFGMAVRKAVAEHLRAGTLVFRDGKIEYSPEVLRLSEKRKEEK